MNAEELIEDVSRIIAYDPAYDEDLVIKFLNRGQLYIAGEVLMTGLADGHNTVTTVINANDVVLPDDFHRELFSATVDGDSIKIFASKSLMIDALGPDFTRNSKVVACTVNGRSITYINRPVVPVVVDLSYYRKPTKMTISGRSFPDGMLTDSDTYDSALISFAAWKIFSEIEQGLEGNKTDTMYHKGLLEQYVEELKTKNRDGQSSKSASTCRGDWP